MTSLRLTTAASLLALLTACSGGQGGTGKVSVLLTDAPAGFKAAVVTIDEVDLVAADGTSVTLATPHLTTNLLSLANDTAQLVNGASVPVGAYAQLRFVISGGYVEVPTSETTSDIYASSPTYSGLPAGATVAGKLQMPSYAQSGLKIDLPGGSVQVGTEAHVLLVDFDVSQSFGHEAGASGQWVMHPVCTATELELSGTVDVQLALSGAALPGGATLALFSAELTNAAGSAKTLPLVQAPDGTYGASFPFLIPGAYTLRFTYGGTGAMALASFTTTPATPVAVTVASGQPTNLGFAVTAVTLPPAQ